MSILTLSIIWIIGGIVNVFTSERVRDYKNYSNPETYLLIGLFLCFTMSWALTYLNIVHDEFYIPEKIYHDCMKHAKITFEDIDYDKNGMVMKKYDHDLCDRRETYRIYTCQYCGKVIKKEKLQ